MSAIGCAIGCAIGHAIRPANKEIRRYPAFSGDISGNQSTNNKQFSGVSATFVLWPF